jgi:hypothetical protein
MPTTALQSMRIAEQQAAIDPARKIYIQTYAQQADNLKGMQTRTEGFGDKNLHKGMDNW